MNSSIPQPSYPGGGQYGTPPSYQPINTTQVMGASQQQDLAAQALMLKNFANVYPTVNTAQGGFQTLLQGSNNLTDYMQSGTNDALANQLSQMYGTNNIASGLSKYGTMLGGPMGTGAVNQISNAAKGIYANPNLQTAYNTFTGEASGAQPINPIVQQQMMQAGLTNAAQNLAPTSLGTGQTGEAQVATNFGQNAQAYIQNMQNAGLQGMQGLQSNVQGGAQNTLSALQALTGQYLGANQQSFAQGSGLVGEEQQQQGVNSALESLQAQMFPRTQIGLTGTDLANMMIANTQGQNQFNQNTWLAQMQAAQYNSSVQGANAGMSNASSSGLAGAGIGAVATIAVVAFCWVAREVFGDTDAKWLRFRKWMLHKAPDDFKRFYLEKGAELARMLKSQPEMKDLIRHLMLGIIEKHA